MRKGFTLIELLVVIAIVAVLAVVVVLVLNPAQLIQQSRDSNRISDMASLNSAISLYLADAGVAGTVNLGSSSVVYVSVPDPSATTTAGDACQGLGLPTLPLAYSYHCATSSTFRMTNATGWIPVNFAGMGNGSPLGQLPIDPTNSTSSRLYYTYATNGSQYEVTSVPESSKYKLGGANDIISPDGGTLASVFEKGSRLGLEPLDYGDNRLAGYWTFEEGSSSIAYDYSGTNATGSWSGTPTGTAGYYSAGKIGSWAGAFDGSSTDLNLPISLFTTNGGSYTIALWANPSALGTRAVVGLGNIITVGLTSNNPSASYWDGSNSYALSGAASAGAGQWIHLAYVINANAGSSLYVNGALASSTGSYGAGPAMSIAGGYRLIGSRTTVNDFFSGQIDDVRIYNRALTAAEIQALYNGGK